MKKIIQKIIKKIKASGGKLLVLYLVFAFTLLPNFVFAYSSSNSFRLDAQITPIGGSTSGSSLYQLNSTAHPVAG